jgi:hypothetical protein
MKTLKDLTPEQLETLNHLTNLRNDFYNRGDNVKYNKVQKDIDKLMQS